MLEQTIRWISNRFPSTGVLVCAMLSSAIPYAIYKLNRKLHEKGNPPWKN